MKTTVVATLDVSLHFSTSFLIVTTYIRVTLNTLQVCNYDGGKVTEKSWGKMRHVILNVG